MSKEQVIEAVQSVCDIIGGWHMNDVFLKELYDKADAESKFNDKNLEEQIDTLGAEVVYMYLSRYVKHQYGTRLDLCIFRRNADDFIRLLSWSQSAARGVLIDFRGGRLPFS